MLGNSRPSCAKGKDTCFTAFEALNTVRKETMERRGRMHLNL
jgi:hypothetical protein